MYKKEFIFTKFPDDSINIFEKPKEAIHPIFKTMIVCYKNKKFPGIYSNIQNPKNYYNAACKNPNNFNNICKIIMEYDDIQEESKLNKSKSLF
jgi:hypothetical protein